MTLLLTLAGLGVSAIGALDCRAAAAYQTLDSDPVTTERTINSLAHFERPSEQKVWVFFRDKHIFDDTSYLARLEQVSISLDAHAAERRAKVLAPPFVDYLDVPIHNDYVQQLLDAGLTLEVESRWLNAVSGRGSIDTWKTVAELPFVQSLQFVRGGRAIHPVHSEGTNEATGSRGTIDYGFSFDQLNEINVVAAHNLGLTGAGVRIAMLDTGYYQDHAAFTELIANGQLLAQWDFINDDDDTQDGAGDSFGQHLHGTLTWSIVAGYEETELIGAAYGADFLLAKTEDTSMEAPVEEDYWVEGMEWADLNGADVISSSLGYKEWYDYSDLDGQTAVTTIGADIAVGRGIVVCTAMGNEGTTDWYYLIAPADANLTVSVGGSTPSGDVWDQSGHGPTFDGRTKPEVVARGSLTYGAASPEDHLGEGYRSFDGTSVATPLVSGAVALLLEAHPEWTPEIVREALMMTADNSSTPDNDRGWGRIDVIAALDYVPASVPKLPAIAIAPVISASPNPFASQTTVSLSSGFSSGPVLVELFSPDGRKVQSRQVQTSGRQLRVDLLGEPGRIVSPGIYLLRISQGEIEARTKVVVQR